MLIADFGQTDSDLTTLRIIQGNNTYIEKFGDTEFKDSTYTTGNWNTTTKRYTANGSEILQTSSIDYNNTGVNEVKLTLTGTSGNTYIEIDASKPGQNKDVYEGREA